MKVESRRVALVGLPGAGKSTVGELAAGKLGWTFHDCDAVFEAQWRTSISDWVNAHGWPAFREHEHAILAAAFGRGNCVIATGGGAVEKPENRSLLREHGFVVWLDASLEVLRSRLADSHERPLLAAESARRFVELAERRAPLYRDVADVRIALDHDPVHVVVQRIVTELPL